MKAADQDRPIKAGGPYAWYVAALLCLVLFMSLVDRYLMSVVMVPLKAELLLSDTQLGLLSGFGFAVLYCTAAIPIGLLVDFTNRVRIMAIGLLVWTLATGASAFANSFETLLIARLFVGLGEAVVTPAGMSILASYFLGSQLGRATSIFLMGGTLGKAFAFICGGALLSYLTVQGGLSIGIHFAPWQALFLAAAVIGAPIILLFFLTVREPPRAVSKARPGMRQTFTHIWGNRGIFLPYFAFGTCLQIVGTIYGIWAPSFYVRQFGIDVAYAALITGVASLCVGPLGYWVGGVVLDRLKTTGVSGAPNLVASASMGVSALACVMFSVIHNLPLSVFFYAVAQFTIMLGVPALWAGVPMITPERQRGLTMALYVCVANLGALALGPAIIGAVNDFAFAGEALGASIAIVAAAFAAVGVPTALMTRKAFDKAAAEVKVSAAG